MLHQIPEGFNYSIIYGTTPWFWKLWGLLMPALMESLRDSGYLCGILY
jgi:hypothetical protein